MVIKFLTENITTKFPNFRPEMKWLQIKQGWDDDVWRRGVGNRARQKETDEAASLNETQHPWWNWIQMGPTHFGHHYRCWAKLEMSIFWMGMEKKRSAQLRCCNHWFWAACQECWSQFAVAKPSNKAHHSIYALILPQAQDRTPHRAC